MKFAVHSTCLLSAASQTFAEIHVMEAHRIQSKTTTVSIDKIRHQKNIYFISYQHKFAEKTKSFIAVVHSFYTNLKIFFEPIKSRIK